MLRAVRMAGAWCGALCSALVLAHRLLDDDLLCVTCSWVSCLVPSAQRCWISFLGKFYVPSRYLSHQGPWCLCFSHPAWWTCISRTFGMALNLPIPSGAARTSRCVPLFARWVPRSCVGRAGACAWLIVRLPIPSLCRAPHCRSAAATPGRRGKLLTQF